LRTLVKNEIIADRDMYGDARRSPIIERQGSAALREEDILPNEPITVVLSQMGWIRAAKGYDVDGQSLGYKTSDSFRAQTNARSNQQVVFFDSEGKVYNLPGHALPSARGQGEPLTGKLNPADGMSFVALVSGEPEDHVFVASDAGYGFITQLKDLYVKNRNGKACLKLPTNSQVLPPKVLSSKDSQQVVCITNAGRLLIFAASELPELTRGKGNKFISIPSAKASAREELVIDVQIISPGDELTVHAGKRHFTLKAADLQHYQGERGRRGNRLPRGLQNVTSLQVTPKSG
jgi:topoisomerase-4 subunit A